MAITHADRFRWEQDVLANPQLTAAQKIVLTRLALHLNIKTGRCDPSVKTLATGAGMAERTVQATLSRAETLGIIERAIAFGAPPQYQDGPMQSFRQDVGYGGGG